MAAEQRIIVLEHDRIQRKLRRIAFRIYEDHVHEPGIVIVGVAPRGSKLAERLKRLLEEISPLKADLLELALDKADPLHGPVRFDPGPVKLEDRVVVLVDDVVMSGRTLMHAAAHLLASPVKRLTTVALVDRLHRAYPIRADIVGLTLSTTLQEHISVELGRKDTVYLT
jgi:pyrimidine operon attenuation protein/uracil phosphoribosyltransferase